MKAKRIKVILSKFSFETLLAIQDPKGIKDSNTIVEIKLATIISKFKKSKEFFNQIANLEDANPDIKLQAQKRLNRDLSD